MTRAPTPVHRPFEEPLLRLEEAVARLLEGVAPLPVEEATLAEAAGRVLAADVVAEVALPPWDNVAMDGFAVRAGDIASATVATPVRLRVAGEVAAGHEPSAAVEPGTALRVSTGAPLPPGADAVVPVEETSAWGGARAAAGAVLGSVVEIHEAVPGGANVRPRGGDAAAGARVLAAGQRLTAGAISLVAAVGRERVAVVRRPRVAVLATGDELVPPGRPLGPAQIHDSNTAGLLVLARRAGAEVRSLGIAPDDLDAVRERLREALGWADIVVASGGVSVGAHDVVKDAFETFGRLGFWRVAIQPGKPLAFGRAPRGPGAPPGGPVLFFGLPGNPVSSLVTFELFVRPALRRLGGHPDTGRRLERAVLAEEVEKSHGRRAFLRVRLAEVEGRLVARLAGAQGSHVLSALAAADALAVIPEEEDRLPPGSEVDVWRIEEA